jgi:hypothetical protein
MRSFLKLLLSFAPWLAFLVIAQGGLVRLKLGLAVALATSVVMGLARLHRGIILWVGLAFFTYALVAVALLNDLWTARHMGILANGALALGSWLTIATGKPFTLDYARDHTDPSLWNEPAFIRSNVVITTAWALVFTVNALLAWGKMTPFLWPEWGYEIASYVLLIAAAAFTTWYPGHCRRLRQREEQAIVES